MRRRGRDALAEVFEVPGQGPTVIRALLRREGVLIATAIVVIIGAVALAAVITEALA